MAWLVVLSVVELTTNHKTDYAYEPSMSTTQPSDVWLRYARNTKSHTKELATPQTWMVGRHDEIGPWSWSGEVDFVRHRPILACTDLVGTWLCAALRYIFKGIDIQEVGHFRYETTRIIKYLANQ